MGKNYKKSDYKTFHITYFWMSTLLNLKGIDKDIFALIYGYTKKGLCYSGSLEYLIDWTGHSKQCVLDSLQRLQGIDPSINYKERKARQKSVHFYKLINKREKSKGNEYRSLITAQNIDGIIAQINKLKDEQDTRNNQSEIQTNIKLKNQSDFQCNQSEIQTNNGLNFRHNNISKYIKYNTSITNENCIDLIDHKNKINFLAEREKLLEGKNIIDMSKEELEKVGFALINLIKKYRPDMSESEISKYV